MEQSELVRQAMRRWASGVAVVTTRWKEIAHGMTVNSFTSISLDPPILSVSMINQTRTCTLVKQSGVLGLTILRETQKELSDHFAGKVGEDEDRLAGVAHFTMVTGSPLISGGLAYLDCRVIFEYPMPYSTLFLAEVTEARLGEAGIPLIYHNRGYPRLAFDME